MKNLLTVFRHQGVWKIKDSRTGQVSATHFPESVFGFTVYSLLKTAFPESVILMISEKIHHVESI